MLAPGADPIVVTNAVDDLTDHALVRAGRRGTHALTPAQQDVNGGRSAVVPTRRPTPRMSLGDRLELPHRTVTDERKLDAVEALLPLAHDAGLSVTHLAVAFAVTHPDVTAAIIGPRTMDQLQDLLAGAEVVLDDDVLDRIDQIVPPGVDLSPLDVSYVPPSVGRTDLRRHPGASRSAA